MYSRFKQEMGDTLDRIMAMIRNELYKEDMELYEEPGVDGTGITVFSRKDMGAGWGYDHLEKRYFKGYKLHLVYIIKHLVTLAYKVTSASMHDNKAFWPLLKKLGDGLLKTTGVLADKAYDSKDNMEKLATIGVSIINPRNKRKAKKYKPKYRLQDYCPVHGNMITHIYRPRYNCEVTNSILKERLNIERIRSIGIRRIRIKLGLTLIARQIQVLSQFQKGTNTRTTITN